MKWEQPGFALVAVVPEAAGMPLLHGFYLPEWEANQAKREAESLPDHLINGLRVVPAKLVFELPDNAALTGAHGETNKNRDD